MPKVAIDRNKELTRGDIVELHFVSSGMAWIKATQIAILDDMFKDREDWVIRSFQTPEDRPTLIIMTVEVLGGKRPEGATPGASGEWLISGLGPILVAIVITCTSIAGVIITAGIIYNLTLKETFLVWAEAAKEVVTSAEGKIAVAGTGIGIAAAGIAFLLFYILPKK